jgi:hypothetical protein
MVPTVRVREHSLCHQFGGHSSRRPPPLCSSKVSGLPARHGSVGGCGFFEGGKPDAPTSEIEQVDDRQHLSVAVRQNGCESETVRMQHFSFRVGVISTTIVAALAGLTGSAGALPSDPVAEFTPTVALVPGGNCAAIIDAETVLQPQSGTFGVRAKITQTGQ